MSEQSPSPDSNAVPRRALVDPVARILRAMAKAARAAAAQAENALAEQGAPMDRREFLRTTAAATTVAATGSLPLPALAETGATGAAASPGTMGMEFGLEAFGQEMLALARRELGLEDDFDRGFAGATKNLMGRVYTDAAPIVGRLKDRTIASITCGNDWYWMVSGANQKGIPRKEFKDAMRRQIPRVRKMFEALARGETIDEARRQMENTPPQTMDAAPSFDPLVIAVDLANIGLKWDPASKRLTLSRPPLHGLFEDDSTLSEAEKLAARDDVMRQLAEIAQAQYAGRANVTRYGITFTDPPPVLLERLGIDPAKPLRQELGVPPSRQA
jgi:hypothetical protein